MSGRGRRALGVGLIAASFGLPVAATVDTPWARGTLFAAATNAGVTASMRAGSVPTSAAGTIRSR